jgi:small GTP-binding protein
MSIISCVVGHVDFGKSTLIGQILYKCKHYDEHTVEQAFAAATENKLETFKFSFLLDTLDEERRRGKTMDYTAIDFKYNAVDYTLIDTPGHRSLIRSLIAGINNYDTSLIVGVVMVSVEENEYNSGMRGQTKEDIILLKACGIENVVIVFNKMDLIKWDMAQYEKRKDNLNNFVKRLGFNRVDYHNMSAYEGKNVLELLDLIKKINSQEINKKPAIKSERINELVIPIQLKIINAGTDILCAGYECMIHIKEKEFQIVFDDVRLYDTANKKIMGQKFGKENNVIIAKIKSLDGFKFEVQNTDRVILRKGDITVGFGKIYVKPGKIVEKIVS